MAPHYLKICFSCRISIYSSKRTNWSPLSNNHTYYCREILVQLKESKGLCGSCVTFSLQTISVRHFFDMELCGSIKSERLPKHQTTQKLFSKAK